MRWKGGQWNIRLCAKQSNTYQDPEMHATTPNAAPMRLLLAIPFFLVRAVVVEEFVRDDALPSHLEEHSTIKKVILRVKATHQVVQVRFVRQDRVCQLLVLLLRSFLPGDVFGGDHVALEEGYGSSLSRHESGLV